MSDAPILTSFLEDADVILYAGDCVDVMRRMPEASVDAIVTDPPYELGFMGKAWDGTGIAYQVDTWAAALRVLKPGGHLLAFSGTRTYHRMTCAIEDAGFEIRDCIAWMYGSGFPKSLDVSKAIDKQRHDKAEIYEVTAWIREARDAAGITNRDIDAAFEANGMGRHWTDVPPNGKQPAVPTLEQVPQLLELLRINLDDVPDRIRHLLWDLNGRKGQPGEAWFQRDVIGQSAHKPGIGNESKNHYTVGGTIARHVHITAPATDAARKWSGWGTALKPAFEPIVVARKPLTGTVAQNVLEHGTGALNIDACRIGADGGTAKGNPPKGSSNGIYGDGLNGACDIVQLNAGRWPANVALDATAANMLDQQSGTTTSGAAGRKGSSGFADGYDGEYDVPYGDTGGASRFFYTAKASRQDRNAGGLADNTHPTVKPTELMRWLIRLVTPPGGIILDPFGGSGSTGLAARAENVRCILIEREPEYLNIIRDRLAQLSLLSELLDDE